jgi:hypothetical protein
MLQLVYPSIATQRRSDDLQWETATLNAANKTIEQNDSPQKRAGF